MPVADILQSRQKRAWLRRAPAQAPPDPRWRTRFRERQARRDQRDNPDRIEPTLAAEPMESADAKEPTDPIDRIEPAEPMDKIEPADPIDKIDPLDPMLRIEPAEPLERDEPAWFRMLASSQA